MVAVFEGIQAAFPTLRMAVQVDHPHVDVNVDIVRQPGLAFDVNLNQQGDELHLSLGTFWLEWFPCSKPEVVAQYQEAVEGVLSGAFRILEHRVGRWPVKAQLQRPDGDGWETIGTTGHWGVVVPWPRTKRVLQNRVRGDAVEQGDEADEA
jgi:hypothetical protein